MHKQYSTPKRAAPQARKIKALLSSYTVTFQLTVFTVLNGIIPLLLETILNYY